MSIESAMKRANARAKEENFNERARKREVEMAEHRVQDIEDWIRLVQTRTRAIELLRRFTHDAEVAAFLEEVEKK